MNRLQKQALKAKEAGYEWVTSVVKQYKATTYYHVNSVERILETGKWNPAPFNHCGWRGRVGVASSNLPEGKIISRKALYSL